MITDSDNVHGDEVEGNKVEVGPISGSQNVNIAGSNIFQRINNFFVGDSETQRALRNRQNMLQLVWNTWIEGVLKKSLHNEVLIELGMETKPDAVEHPWDMVMQMPDREPEMVKPGTTMLELFDQTNGSLLILGEPGSGKTTMLLELARLAILRAQEAPLQPIPVVFNLSSWKPHQAKKGRKEQSPCDDFADWLVDELRGKYYVPEKIGRLWIENDALLLLLDGLDEVGAENRDACVRAINAFRAEHTMSLVVCSRKQEYEGLDANLNLRGAVMIQALSEEQVEEYLHKAGAGLAAVLQALMRDADLREFAQTPLVLSILALAYRDVPEADLRALEAGGDCRQQLFDAYIAQMFKRRGSDLGYTAENTRKWLSWLAHRMVEQGQSLFYLENIQLSWVSWPGWKIRLVDGLVVGLIGGLAGGLVVGLVFGLADGLVFGLFFGLVVGLIGGQSVKEFIEPTERLRWSMQEAKGGLVVGLVDGLVGGLVVGLAGVLVGGLVGRLVGRLRFGLVDGLVFGLFYGLVVGLVAGLFVGLDYGGTFLIAHFTARFSLFRSGHLPWNLIPFLDYCTDCIFLRKVGGGYIFIHRMLMEHFAEMDEERIQAVAQTAAER